MIKGVIFDLDGVICFTDKYHYQAWKVLAEEQGIYFDEVINNRLRGVSRMDSLDIILERAEREYSAEEKLAMAEQKNALYRQLLAQMTPADLPAEVSATLKELRVMGYQLAIGSSSKNTPMILERISLAGFFDAVSDGNNITRSKPDPEVFLKAAEFLGLAPEECVVVEDAIAGVEAAHNAGMIACAVGDAAEAKVGDYNMKSVADLIEILKQEGGSMIDLRANPFYLSEEQVKWVEDTLASMTLEEKAGQVFCPMGFNDEPATLKHLVQEVGVGAIMYRPAPADNIQKTHRFIQDLAKIPLLLAANTESGGNGLAFEGTSFGQPMAVAATGDVEDAYRMGKVACSEGAALGLNWSFAPIVDIDMDFHNPITNTRTFGSDPQKVIDCASAYMKAAGECGVAVAIKHFPGDGSDERDQHILTGVNTLDCDAWMETYGKVYKTLIDKGAKTVMAGHIAQPAWAKRLNPEATNRQCLLPASLSKEVLTGLLRGELGFNGLISTDATPMVGFCAAMPRRLAVPTAIAAGADMILFNKSLDEDYGFLMDGIRDGILTVERLDEAVTRILATKASLGLPEKKANGTVVPGPETLPVVGCEQHRTWAKEVADKAVTLVKDTQNLLPISPKKFKRVYLNVIQRDMSPENPVVQMWKTLFEQERFEVTVRDRRTTITMMDMLNPDKMSDAQKALMYEMYRAVGEVHESYDLYVYIANMENASNNTTLRLNWNVAFGLGDDAPWLVSEVPAMMISTAYPYHMFDAPMIDTFINSYSAAPDFCQAVMDKIMGRSEFKGISPVDPFCGNEFLRMTAQPDKV